MVEKNGFSVPISFKVTPDLRRRIWATAEAMGLDPSSLIRMILTRGLPEHERWASHSKKDVA